MPRRHFVLATVLLAALGLFGVAACSDDSDPSTVSGSIGKLDRSGLPDDAVVNVELRDVSLADAPAETLDKQVIDLDGNQLPVDYELSYDPDQIDERHSYTVFVRIESGDDLLYITDTAYPVISSGNPTSDVEVTVVPAG